MKTKNVFLSGLFAGLLLTGCLPPKNAEELVPGSGDITMPSGILGAKSRCGIHGATSGTYLNGKAYTIYLSLNADGTFSYSVWYTTTTTCVASGRYATPGGEDLFRFNQNGVWTLTGLNADGTYKVLLVPKTQSLTPRTDTHGVLMKDAVNTNCNLTLNGGFNLAVVGTYCDATNTVYRIPTIPNIDGAIYQTFKDNGSNPLSGPSENVFYFGHYATHPEGSAATVQWHAY